MSGRTGIFRSALSYTSQKEGLHKRESRMEKRQSFYRERLLYHMAELLYEEECIDSCQLQKLKAFIAAGDERYDESGHL